MYGRRHDRALSKWRSDSSRAGLSDAPSAAGLRGKYECEVASPAEGDDRARQCQGRDLALHGIDAQWEGAPVYVPARREIRDRQAIGWNEYERAGLLRNLRAGVVRIGASFQSRSLDRRRKKLDCCRTHSAGIVESTDSL